MRDEIMNDHPDYSNYSREELTDAYSNIDREKYPERLKLIEIELARKTTIQKVEVSKAVTTEKQKQTKCAKCGFQNDYMARFCSECGVAISDFPKPAGFWIRVGASFVDILPFIPILVLTFINLIYWKSYILFIALFIPGVLYKPLMEYKFSATLGKMMCDIKVIDLNGYMLSLKAAFMRSLPNIISSILGFIGLSILFSSYDYLEAESFLEVSELIDSSSLEPLETLVNIFIFIDVLFIVFSHRKRAVHDFMAKTYCVYKA